MAAVGATHSIPDGGLPAWTAPDPRMAPSAQLPARLPVSLVRRDGDWGQVADSGGWIGWVDARRLVAPAEQVDTAVLDALGGALDTYRRLVDDLAAARIDVGAFRRGAFAAGLIVRDGEAWLFDLDRGRWARYDGVTVAFGEALDTQVPAAAPAR